MKPNLQSETTSRLFRPCITCRTAERKLLYRNNLSRIAGLDLSYDVGQCTRCGTAFADAVAAPADYASYYAHCSKYDCIASVTEIPAIDRRRADFAADFVCKNVPANDSVLDLGCGSGVLLAEFRRYGWRSVKGIDPAPSAAASAQRLFGLDGVKHGTTSIVDQYFAVDAFDLICMTAVLEHLTEPLDALQGIVDRMRANAFLLIEVPALESFGRAPLEPYGELSIEHINFFSQRTLVAMAARAGLRPVASAILDLSPLATDSLYVLFKKGASDNQQPIHDDMMRMYLQESAIAQRPVLDRSVEAIKTAQAVIWGAGSHSGRLLPMLERLGLDGDIQAIVDSNPNLHGRQFGSHEVLPTEALAQWPNANVIVSSFRSSAPIAARIKSCYKNPVCELYGPLIGLTARTGA